MKKILVLFSFIFMSCTFSLKNAEANDYNSATAIFLITEKLKGTNLDEGAIMNAETQRLIHKMSLDIIDVMFDNLPNILDSISADMRLKADKNYKCSLQSNDYKNKECEWYGFVIQSYYDRCYNIFLAIFTI